MFPVINHISDVLPAIAGCDEFLVADRGTHTVINYLVVKPDTFPPLDVAGGSAKMRAERKLHNAFRRECRGLLFDPDGNIIRRPLHKFFNINEREETLARNIDLSRPHVILEKLDGSSISPFRIGDGTTYESVVYGTRMGDTEIGQQAADFAKTRHQYYELFVRCEVAGLTPIFEWCSRQQRIVIDHPEDQLVLLAIRKMTTGEYTPYERLKMLAEELNIPVVQTVGVGYNGSTDDLVEIVRGLPMAEYGEGIVVCFQDTGEMVKLKLDEYCLIHRAKERILEERYVVEDIINGDIDDVKATVLEEDRDAIDKYQQKFWTALDVQADELGQWIHQMHRKYPNRKDFALSSENRQAPKFHNRCVFWFYEVQLAKASLSEYIIENRIRPALGTRTKFGEMKNECFPNIRYKY